jgi:hypothetical protein
MDERGEKNDDESHNRSSDEGVGNAAMMLKLVDLAAKTPDDVKIGGLGGECSDEGGAGGFAIQAGAADACASEKVSDRLHGFWEPYYPATCGGAGARYSLA